MCIVPQLRPQRIEVLVAIQTGDHRGALTLSLSVKRIKLPVTIITACTLHTLQGATSDPGLIFHGAFPRRVSNMLRRLSAHVAPSRLRCLALWGRGWTPRRAGSARPRVRSFRLAIARYACTGSSYNLKVACAAGGDHGGVAIGARAREGCAPRPQPLEHSEATLLRGKEHWRGSVAVRRVEADARLAVKTRRHLRFWGFDGSSGLRVCLRLGLRVGLGLEPEVDIPPLSV